MNSPLKKKVEKFSRLEEQCQSKIALINSIKENKSKGTATTLLFNRLIMSSQKVQEKPIQLPFKQFININFDTSHQKTVIIKEKEILSQLQDGKMFVIMVESDFQIHATLILNLNGFQKRVNFKVFGTKAIPINQYFKQDVKLILFAQKVKSMSQVRVHLDLIKSSFSSGNKFNTISPRRQKQQIEEFLKQNRGRSAEILRRRSETREKQKRDRFISSAASFKTIFSDNIFDPTASFYNKKQKSQLHLFQTQKTKYINHMKKMCPDKQVLLKRTQSQYMSKKQQQVMKFASLIVLCRFQKASRVMILKQVNERIKRIKVSMLATDFCMLMKAKLRFKITQKARYRMAIRTPLAFLGEIFYALGKPKAQKKVTDCLQQVQTFKTLLKLSQQSVKYIQKLKIIQRYARKKRAQMRQRANIIFDQLMKRYYIKESDLKEKRQVLIEKYLKVCYSEVKGMWTAGLYQKTDVLLKMMTQK